MSSNPQHKAISVTKSEPIEPATEFAEITLNVGPGGHRSQRFVGKQVGEAREVTKVGVTATRIFVSRKGKYVVQTQQSDWQDFTVLTNWTRDWKNWRNLIGLGDNEGAGDFTVDVVDTLDELRTRVPSKVYREVADVVQNPGSQDLDV
ncbi:EXLDI protein [Nocardia sp. NPDC051832]|uniref:EXLDI protein n=1 Tax=Nocardia sp. NPDC051832 TaxID=3155673 RepID=UPI003417222F